MLRQLSPAVAHSEARARLFSRISKNGQTKATSRLSESQAASLSLQVCSSLGKSTALKHKSQVTTCKAWQDLCIQSHSLGYAPLTSTLAPSRHISQSPPALDPPTAVQHCPAPVPQATCIQKFPHNLLSDHGTHPATSRPAAYGEPSSTEIPSSEETE